jgi:hypothetical protein
MMCGRRSYDLEYSELSYLDWPFSILIVGKTEVDRRKIRRGKQTEMEGTSAIVGRSRVSPGHH